MIKSDQKIIKNIFALSTSPEVEIENNINSFYLNDNMASPRVKIDELGNVEKKYKFTSFGFGAAEKNIGFTGYQTEQNSNLLFAQARYYMPKIGRFISEDPHNEILTNPLSLNKYMYCYNNPLKFIDPTGYIAGDLAVKVVSIAEDLHNWLESVEKWCTNFAINFPSTKIYTN